MTEPVSGNPPDFEDKFVAFIDILGFKSMVEASEAGTGRSVEDLIGLMRDLGTAQSKAELQAHGPTICPESRRIAQDVGFELTQASDCAIISTELSPAGLISMLNHCWISAMALLRKGVLIRGYITRGRIHHCGATVLGTGYHSAYKREQGVTAFRIEVDEVGTPFIEIDATVQTYLREDTDPCVRKMADRMTRSHEGTMAIYPFKAMSHGFGIGADFDVEREKRSNENVRRRIQRYRDAIASLPDAASEKVARKIRHYLAALDAQLAIADQTDGMIDFLSSPVSPRYPG